jgi:hypothetical protein
MLGAFKGVRYKYLKRETEPTMQARSHAERYIFSTLTKSLK